MDISEITKYINNLSVEEILRNREMFDDYIDEACNWYALDLNLFDFYWKLTTDTKIVDFLQEAGAFPIEWSLDLHQSDNYDNFKDCLSEVLRTLCAEFDEYYLEVFQWGRTKNFTFLEAAQKLYDNSL